MCESQSIYKICVRTSELAAFLLDTRPHVSMNKEIVIIIIIIIIIISII